MWWKASNVELTNIGVIVANNELIIQIYPHFKIVGKSLLVFLMYRTTTASFIELTTTMLEEELYYEIKGTWKVEHEGLNVNHYNKHNDYHSYKFHEHG